jgi:hypothetical protein
MSYKKLSINQYRNINGNHYICWEYDSTKFGEEKRKAKKQGLKYRVIDGQFYIEVKEENNVK